MPRRFRRIISGWESFRFSTDFTVSPRYRLERLAKCRTRSHRIRYFLKHQNGRSHGELILKLDSFSFLQNFSSIFSFYNRTLMSLNVVVSLGGFGYRKVLRNCSFLRNSTKRITTFQSSRSFTSSSSNESFRCSRSPAVCRSSRYGSSPWVCPPACLQRETDQRLQSIHSRSSEGTNPPARLRAKSNGNFHLQSFDRASESSVGRNIPKTLKAISVCISRFMDRANRQNYLIPPFAANCNTLGIDVKSLTKNFQSLNSPPH